MVTDWLLVLMLAGLLMVLWRLCRMVTFLHAALVRLDLRMYRLQESLTAATGERS